MTDRTDRRASLVLALVSAAILFDALDLSITQIALPSIQKDLKLSPAALQWVPNAYVLTYGGLLLLGGRAADLGGRRRVFVGGLALFAAMSLVCGLAPSAAVLVMARGLQGVGAAMTVPAAVSIIATTFAEGPPRNRALGVFAASASAGFSVGLVLGGVLTDVLDWRWIFLVKVPVVALVAVVALRAIDDGRSPSAPRGSYDAAGAAASASGLLLLVFVITQLAHRTVSPAAVLVAALLAVGLLAGFAVHERRTEAPLLPLSLFRLGTLRAADLASLTVLAAPFGFSYVSTLYYQDVQGHSPLATGLALLPGAVLSAFVSRYVAPALVARVGLRTAAVGGMALVSAGFAGLLGIAADASYLTTLLPTSIVCLGLGMGIAYPVFTIGAVTGVEDEEQGVAAGIQNTALQVGGGLGLAIVAGAVAARLGDARDTHALVDALRVGAAVGALLPLLGAVVALVGLRSQRRGGHAS
jgi:EmrB/QacA subfamily drug resistance transporter